MRRKTFLAWGIAAVLTVVQLGSVPVFADSSPTTVETTVSSADWIEGEAVVLTAGMPLLQGGIGSDTETVVHTSTFPLHNTAADGIENLPLLGSAAALPESISVSLVRSETETTEELIARLEQQSNVICAEPNRRMKTQSLSDHLDSLWGLENVGQNNGTPNLDLHVNAIKGTLRDTDAVIAVVDTGIDVTHPDLQPYLWENPYAATGELEGQHGYDCVNWDDDPSDDMGHGTHCAGIITSVLEQAEAENVKIMALKALDADGQSGFYSEIAAYEYIYQAQQLGVNVVSINNSWGGMMIGGDDSSDIMNLIVTLVGEQGALSICAAGNESLNTDYLQNYPSCLDNPYIISVAATNENGKIASFSNYGVKTVDLAAPGVNILSTYHMPYFEPDAFNATERETLLAYSNGCSEGVPKLVGATELVSGTISQELVAAFGTPEAEQSLTVSQDRFFGRPDADEAGSLCWEYTVPEETTTGVLYLGLPCTVDAGETRDFNFRFRVEIDGTDCTASIKQNTLSETGAYGEVEQEITIVPERTIGTVYNWNNIISEIDGANGKAHAVAIYLSDLTVGGKVQVYLDDLNISEVNVDDAYPKYTYMNGTSMATPYVTAAAGLIALRTHDATALDWATDLLCATYPVEDLPVKTNGILDLSQCTSGRPAVLDTELDTETGQLTVTGRNLSAANVSYTTPAWATVEVLSQTNTEIVFDVSDFKRCFLQMTLHDLENRKIFEIYQYYPTGTMPKSVALLPDQDILVWDRQIFCMDGKFYALNGDGCVYGLDLQDGWTILHDGTFPELDGRTGIGTGVFAAQDGQMMAIVMYEGETDFCYHCMRYDFKEDTWTDCGDLTEILDPNVKASNVAFAADGGVFWMMATTSEYDEDGNAAFTLYQYDAKQNIFTAVSTLPERRGGIFFYWMNGKLVFTQDAFASWDDSLSQFAALPQLIYDPETDTWTTCPVMTHMPMQKTYYGGWDGDFIYNAYMDANNRYLVYTAVGVEGLGDIILYDSQTGQFLSTDYSIYAPSQQGLYQMAADEDMLYFFYADETKKTAFTGAFDMQVCAISFEELAASSKPVEQLGDVDGDNMVAVEDAVMLLTEYAKTSAALGSSFTATQKRLGDIDANGAIGVEDAVSVLTYYATKSAGLTPHF